MNFSNDELKEYALNSKILDKTNLDINTAFLLLINEVKSHDLDNLLDYAQVLLKNNGYNNSINEVYKMTQDLTLEDNQKILIRLCAMDLFNKNILMGNCTILDKINTSDWISHSISVSEFMYNMAPYFNVDKDSARVFGLLHDFGRKYDHSFNHVIKGYEKLYELGYKNEAICCLTHSFLNGGRYCSNERTIDGFSYSNGTVILNSKYKKDDIDLFLEKYNYGNMDLLLNLADLCCTSKGVVEPFERVKDIETRRNIDSRNRLYFITELNNLLIKVNCLISENNIDYFKKIYNNLEEAMINFKQLSEQFYELYNNVVLNKKSKTKKI